MYSPNRDFPGGSDGKASACNAGDPGSVPGLGRSPGEGNGNPLQYSCLENSMDGGACRLQSMRSQRVGHDWATSLHFTSGGAGVKNLPANSGAIGDVSLIPGSGRSSRKGNGNPVYYSYLGNPVDRGAWQATVLGVMKSQTQLSDLTCTPSLS